MKQIYLSPILRITEIEKKDVLFASPTINTGDFGIGVADISEL